MAYLMRQSQWDDSSVATAMVLINYYYGNGRDSVKCSPEPPTVRTAKEMQKFRSQFTSRNNIFFDCVNVKPVPMNSTLRCIDNHELQVLDKKSKYQVRKKSKERANRSDIVRKDFFKQG